MVPCDQLKEACNLSKKLGAEPGDSAWCVSALVAEAGTSHFLKDLDVVHEINEMDAGLIIDAIECKALNGELA